MTKDALAAEIKYFAHLLFCNDFLLEAWLQAILKLFISVHKANFEFCLISKQVKGLPKNMKQMSSSFRIVNLEFFLNEDKVINDKISDPL